MTSNNTKIIRVFEDRQQKIDLTYQETKDILSMKTIVGENNILLQADGNLLIRHFVGFVQVNKTRLLINPKISSQSAGEMEYKKSFDLLMKLLVYSEFINIKKIPTPQTLETYEGDLLELFVGLFIDELLLQFKRDINRDYINQMENQIFIKGKVDFPETIKKNSFKSHLHYVKYDQFSENVLLNRIFKSVIQNLIVRTHSKDNKIKLKQSLLWLEDVDKISLSNEIWDRVNFTRQNFKYKAAFNMAKLFYYNSSPNLNTGDEYTFSFLVPVNELFELYLYKVLNENSLSKYEIGYQGPQRHLAYSEEKNHLILKPDITLLIGNDVKFIIDAKYKELRYENGALKISQSDIYQMIAYSVGYSCNNIALVYPMFVTDAPDEYLIQELKIKNNNHLISIKLIKVDLDIEPDLMANKLMSIIDNYDK